MGLADIGAFPDVSLAALGLSIGLVALFGLAALSPRFRSLIGRLNTKPSRQVTFAVLFAFMLVTTPTGIMSNGLSPVQNAAAGHTWSYTGNTWNSGQTDYPSGIAEFGGNYWIADGGTAYKYDTSWTYQSSATLSSTGSAQDFHKTSGGNILVPDNTDDDVDVYDSNWNYLSSHSVSTQTTTPVGVTEGPNGKYHLVGLGTNVYVYNSDWTLSNTISLSTQTTDMAGIELGANGYWWVLDKTSTQVYKYDSSWTYTGTSYDVGTEDPTPQNLMQADNSGGNWYYLGTDTSTTTNDIYEYGGHAGNPVEGYVKDTSGSAIEGATATLKSSGGSTIATTTTNGSGGYKFGGISDQSGLTVTASQTGYINDTSSSFSMSGSPVTVETLTLKGNINGRVVNQNGEPVPNATVEVWGVNYSNINPDASQTKQERAEELLQQASNPLPEQWDPTVQLAGENGEWANANGKWVGAYSSEDIGTDPWVDGADLSPNLQVPSGEPVHLVVGDPTATGGDGFLATEYDSQIPGKVVSGDTVVVRQLGPDGSTTSTTSVEIDETAGGGLGDPSSLPYGTVRLTPGIYSASVEGSAYTYVFSVGSPQEIAASIEADLTDEADTLTERAAEIRDRLNNNKFKRVTVTTDAHGRFGANVNANSLKTIGVQAYKGPYNLIGKDPKNVTMDDLRSVYTTTPYNGSVVVPAEVERSGVPALGLRVETYEATSPQWSDLSSYANVSKWLDDYLQNGTLNDAATNYLGTTDQNLTVIRDRLANLTEQNQRLNERYQELLEQNNRTEENATTDEEVALLRQAIRDLQGSLQPEDPQTSYGDGTASATIPWSGDISPENVAVTAHFPGSGTSEPVPDEYVSVEKRVGQGDVLHVTDYPVPENAAMVTFGATVSGEDGEQVGSGNIPAMNPNFDGRVLRLESLSVSTLQPGPSEQVRISANPDDDSALVQSLNASVDGPNGAITPLSGTADDVVAFTTDGVGAHRVTLEITDAAGNTWTEGLTVKAGPEDVDHPPSVRARDGFTGTFALAAGGLNGGSVQTTGGSVAATAIAPADDVPSSVHFYTEQVSNNYQNHNYRVLKQSGNAEPEGVRKHLKVFVHTAKLDDGAVIYRNGNEPMGVGEETSAGAVNCDTGNAGCTIRTYTGPDGSVDLTINNNPSVVDRAIHWARKRSPVDVPFIAMNPGSAAAALDGSVAATGGVAA